MSYSLNYTNRASIFDTGDVIEGGHLKSVYDELGESPSHIFEGLGMPYLAGAWFNTARTISGAGVTITGRLEMQPLLLDQTVSFNRISTYVTTVGGVGSVIRMGIYNSDSNGMPSTLVAGSEVTQDGTVLNTSTPGGETLSPEVTLGRGRYYVAGVAQGATSPMPQVYRTGAPHFALPLISTSFTELVATTNVALGTYGVSGSLPASLASATYVVLGSSITLAVQMS